MSSQDNVPLDERIGNECDAEGCMACITGLDDLHPEQVVRIFPSWAWTGEKLLCPRHKESKQ